MTKKIERCQIAGKKITSAQDLLDIGLAADTLRLKTSKDCHERPRENGGPASLPICREGCPFYKRTLGRGKLHIVDY